MKKTSIFLRLLRAIFNKQASGKNVSDRNALGYVLVVRIMEIMIDA